MLECQRHLFDVPREIAYFNCASFSPFLRTVAEAGHGAVDRRVHTWDINSTELADGADRVRALFARLINAEADAIAVTPATSYGVAVAAAVPSLWTWISLLLSALEKPPSMSSRQ